PAAAAGAARRKQQQHERAGPPPARPRVTSLRAAGNHVRSLLRSDGSGLSRLLELLIRVDLAVRDLERELVDRGVEVLPRIEQAGTAALEGVDAAVSGELLARVGLELARPVRARLEVEPEDEVAHVGVEAASDRHDRLGALLGRQIADLAR